MILLSHLVRVVQQWRRFNQTLDELSRLNDRELADIGISRSDVVRIAWQQSEK